jgi:phosphohistidine phosphatase
MKVLIVRHGEAVKGSPDASRTLSEAGKKEVSELAAKVAARGFSPVNVVHSGLVRARETAELLALALNPADGVMEGEDLGAEDSPVPWANTLADMREDIVLVSHMPFVANLAGLLLDDNSAEEVHFSTGSSLCLERRPDGGWKVLWKEKA